MKIAIVGSGISGLALANILKDKHEVVLFEKREQIGGMIKCDRVDSVLFHKVGGHVFNSKNKEVLDWFWSYFDQESEFIKVKRNAKILFQDKIIGYPIENYIYNLEPAVINSIISELLELQKKDKVAPLEYSNFEDFLKASFGETLYSIYFKPYNQKIWKVDLSTVPMPWLDGKLPMPNLQEILISNIVKAEESEMVHSTFFYPLNGGSQFLVDRLSEGLTIVCNEDISSIQTEDGKYKIGDYSGFDKVVYTGDVRHMPSLFDAMLEGKLDLQAIKKFRSNGTSNLLCETDDNDMSWLYLAEAFTNAHRIIYTGNFSPTNNGDRKRRTCVVEFSGKMEYSDMLSEIAKLPGNLTPIIHNYEPNSYVIHDAGTKKLIKEAQHILAEENIHLLGRFAEWEYYNMDKCIEAAMALANKL